MKYIVYEYVGKGALYLVPENDAAEIETARELAREQPERFKKAGIIEMDLWHGASWWNKGRTAGEKPVTRISRRNADYL